MSDAPRHRAHAVGDTITSGNTWVRLLLHLDGNRWQVANSTNSNHFIIELNGTSK